MPEVRLYLNDECCITNDEFCTNNDDFGVTRCSRSAVRSTRKPPPQLGTEHVYCYLIQHIISCCTCMLSLLDLEHNVISIGMTNVAAAEGSARTGNYTICRTGYIHFQYKFHHFQFKVCSNYATKPTICCTGMHDPMEYHNFRSP